MFPYLWYGKWKLITCSAWRNSMNAASGGIGIIFYTRAYNEISSIDSISSIDYRQYIFRETHTQQSYHATDQQIFSIQN